MLRKKTFEILTLALLSVGFLPEVCFGMKRRPVSAPVRTDLDSFDPMTATVDEFGAKKESVWHQMTVRVGSDVAVLRKRIRDLEQRKCTCSGQEEKNEEQPLKYAFLIGESPDRWRTLYEKSQTIIKRQENIISSLRRKNDELQQEKSDLRWRVQGLDSKIIELEARIAELLAKIEKQESRTPRKKPARTRRRRIRKRLRRRTRPNCSGRHPGDKVPDLLDRKIEQALQVCAELKGLIPGVELEDRTWEFDGVAPFEVENRVAKKVFQLKTFLKEAKELSEEAVQSEV